MEAYKEDEFDIIIAEELEALDVNNLDDENDVIENYDKSGDKNEIDFDESFSAYFSLIKIHEETARHRVEEAQNLIEAIDNVKTNKDELLLEKLLHTLDESCTDQVLLVHNRVLKDLEREESQDKDGTVEEKSTVNENQLQLAITDPFEDIFLQEEEARRKLDELTKSQAKNEETDRELYEKKKEERARVDNELQQRREEKQKQVELLQVQFKEQQNVIMQTLNKELKQTEEHLIKIRDREETTWNNNLAVEKSRLQKLQSELEANRLLKMTEAAVIIQKNFKRYSIQKMFKDQLLHIKTNRLLKEQAKQALLRKQQERTKIREDAKKVDDKLRREEKNCKEREKHLRQKNLQLRKFPELSVMVSESEKDQGKISSTNNALSDSKGSSHISYSSEIEMDQCIDENATPILQSSLNSIDASKAVADNLIEDVVVSSKTQDSHPDYLNTCHCTKQTVRSPVDDNLSTVLSYRSEVVSEQLKDKKNVVNQNQNSSNVFISSTSQSTENGMKTSNFANCEKTGCGLTTELNTPIETVGSSNSIVCSLVDDCFEPMVDSVIEKSTLSNKINRELKETMLVECMSVVDEKLRCQSLESDKVVCSNSETTNEFDSVVTSSQECFDADTEDEKNRTESNGKSIHLKSTSSILDAGEMSSQNTTGAHMKIVKNNSPSCHQMDRKHIVEHNCDRNLSLAEVDSAYLGICSSKASYNDQDSHGDIIPAEDVNNPSKIVMKTENKTKQEALNNDQDSHGDIIPAEDIDNSSKIVMKTQNKTKQEALNNDQDSHGDIIPAEDIDNPSKIVMKTKTKTKQEALNNDQVSNGDIIPAEDINNPSKIVMKTESKTKQEGEVCHLNQDNEKMINIFTDLQRLHQIWLETYQKSNLKLQRDEQNETSKLYLKEENITFIRNENSFEIFKQNDSLQAMVLLDCSVKNFDYTSKQLTFLCLKGCEISSFVSASKLLTILDISNNQLASLSAFKQLRSLIFLNVAHNNISSISGLKNCTCLKYLNVDGNQIVSMKGLKNLMYLNVLSCNTNHIMSIDELSSCSLLVEVFASGNSLRKIPVLANNVLLQRLVLNNNDISFCDDLNTYWLPSLKELSVADNRIQSMPLLRNLPYLQTLNVENNLLSETNLFKSLTACTNLNMIYLKGNPVVTILNYSQSLNTFLSWLDNKDGFVWALSQPKQVDTSTAMFTKLCEPVECLMKDIVVDYSVYKSYSNSQIATDIQNQHWLWKKLQDVILKHRKEHQYLFSPGNQELSNDESTTHQKGDNRSAEWITSSSTVNDDFSLDQKEVNSMTCDAGMKESAATRIQSVYRGFKVRQVYLSIQQSSNCERESLANSDDSEFNYAEQIDLSSFHFDDAFMEWSVPETPCIPESLPTLPPIQRKHFDQEREVKKAWGTPPSSRASGELALPAHLLGLSPDGSASDKSELTITERSFASKKAEEIGNEWGFNSLSTAELMLKRAKKMGAGKKKKQLNSDERYLNFKKASESCPTVVSHQKIVSQRKNYFQHTHTESSKNMMTYSWVCNQTVLHQDRAEDIFGIDKRKTCPVKQLGEPVILPPLNSAVLAGRPPSLVQSDIIVPKPPVQERPSSTSSNIVYHRVFSKSPKSHSAPSANERTDPRVNQVNKKKGDMWKQYAYR